MGTLLYQILCNTSEQSTKASKTMVGQLQSSTHMIYRYKHQLCSHTLQVYITYRQGQQFGLLISWITISTLSLPCFLSTHTSHSQIFPKYHWGLKRKTKQPNHHHHQQQKRGQWFSSRSQNFKECLTLAWDRN